MNTIKRKELRLVSDRNESNADEANTIPVRHEHNTDKGINTLQSKEETQYRGKEMNIVQLLE